MAYIHPECLSSHLEIIKLSYDFLGYLIIKLQSRISQLPKLVIWDITHNPSINLMLFSSIYLTEFVSFLREIKWTKLRGHSERNRSSWTYLTASRSWLAICFLLLEGVTHMALIPQIAGTASFSQTTGPLGLPSNTSQLLTEGALLMTSLWKLTVPNWSVFEFGLVSFELVSLDLSSAEDERIL